MGKGLSGLQKSILVMAYERREKGEGTYQRSAEEIARLKAFWGKHPGEIGGSDLPTYYLLAKHFGWYTRRTLDGYEYYFSVKRIGEKKYRSIRASISRSFRRLEERGLVERFHGGINLTKQGVEVAESLTVNKT